MIFFNQSIIIIIIIIIVVIIIIIIIIIQRSKLQKKIFSLGRRNITCFVDLNEKCEINCGEAMPAHLRFFYD